MLQHPDDSAPIQGAPDHDAPASSLQDPPPPSDPGERAELAEHALGQKAPPAPAMLSNHTGSSPMDLESTQPIRSDASRLLQTVSSGFAALRVPGRPVAPVGGRPGGTLQRPAATSPSARRLRASRQAVVAILFCSLLVITSYTAVSGYQQYTRVRAEAVNGVRHLRNVEALLAPYSKQPGIPDGATLQKLQTELVAAQQNFAQVQADLGGGVISAAAHVPGVAGPVNSAAALAAAASEACFAGLDLVEDGALLVPIVKSSVFASGSPTAPSRTAVTPPAPTLDSALLNTVTVGFEDAVHHLNAAVGYARTADLSALPSSLIKPTQITQLRQLIATWPGTQAKLAEVDDWLKVAPVLLGVNAPQSFLVELMDRSELRSTGGFIGNYGVATIQNGKVQPFTLTDTYLLDYPYAWQHNWPKAPSTYSWWPFPGFALRDSNLSADFPTTAQMGMTLLAQEGGPHVQGAIAVTAPAIARMLAVVGPIAVPEYHETVTPQNLEALIHHYQETSAYLSGSDLPPTDKISSTRKRFTALLGRDFINKLHGVPTSELVAIGKTLLTSLHTKDIQIYLGDKAAEALVAKHGFDGALTHGPGDGLTIIDSNVGINKANLFTSVTYADSVALDAHGTATHHLTITYHFASSTAPSMRYLLFGRYDYLTYLRVYTPANVQMAHVDGFNAGHLNLTASDEPGRTMWAGYVLVQDAMPYTLHFVWSAPGVATTDAGGHWHYALDVQHQAGSNQQMSLRVTVPSKTTPIISYTGPLDEDAIYNVVY